MLSKMKNLFSAGKKHNELIDQSNEFIEIIKKSGANEQTINFILENGNTEEKILISLKKLLFFKEKNLDSAVTYLNNLAHVNVAQVFQIAKCLNFKKIVFDNRVDNKIGNKVQKYSFKSGIKCSIVNIEDIQDQELKTPTLYVLDKEKLNYPVITVNNFDNHCLLYLNKNNIGDILNKLYNKEINTDNIIGVCSSFSILDCKNYITKQLIYNICNKQAYKKRSDISEMELMKMFQGNNTKNINFNIMLFALEKSKELAGSGMLSQFNINMSKDQINKGISLQIAIIESMTEKERENPSMLNSSRMQRIAKGSGTTLEQVLNLMKIIQTIKEKGPAMAASMINPATMFNNIKK